MNGKLKCILWTLLEMEPQLIITESILKLTNKLKTTQRKRNLTSSALAPESNHLGL